jgi:hypothetical protein
VITIKVNKSVREKPIKREKHKCHPGSKHKAHTKKNVSVENHHPPPDKTTKKENKRNRRSSQQLRSTTAKKTEKLA